MSRTLTKAEIVDTIYDKVDRSRGEVKKMVESLLSINALLVSGFGKFEAYPKKARKGRNPQTSETITLDPRKVIVFRLSKKFRAEINPQ